jgi:peptidoglycan hydrolase-like protein with peptidoglycan-binding domain
MEILAYIHSAQASDIDASQLDWQHYPRRFPPLINWVRILSIPLTLTMITNTTNALAFLRRGDSGAEVVQLQNQLKSLGYFQARSTGFFASHTLEVVTKFQADHGLPQDGIVGQQTQAAIDVALGNRSNSSSSSVSSSTDNTPNNPNPAIVGNLTPGTTGVAVSKLQDDLRVIGFYTAATTGIYDQATETAVINFQKSQGLTPDGIAGIKTLTSLAKLGGVAPSNPIASSPTPPVKILESRAPLNPTITLQLDSRGEDVRTLQMKLAQLGYYTGGITGVFEDKTYEAVVRFQKDRGLNADGLVKANTWEELAAQ